MNKKINFNEPFISGDEIENIKKVFSSNQFYGLGNFTKRCESAISKIVNEVIKNNQDIVERIKNGEDKLVGFMVGQIIKSSGGSINPGIAKEILSKELNL